MSQFITAMTSLFNFLFTQLTNIAGFITDTTLGQIILGITLFGLIVSLIISLVAKIRG